MGYAWNMSHQRLFERWMCLTHDVRSYNFNLLSRHEFHKCDIITDTTVGIVKPKTVGGINGDISREHFSDWREICVAKEKQQKLTGKWSKFIENKRIQIATIRKNANRNQRLLKN